MRLFRSFATLRFIICLSILGTAGLVLSSCSSTYSVQPDPTSKPVLTRELNFYGWSDEDQIAGLFDAFEEIYGISVNYIAFDSMEEGIAALRAGSPQVDIIDIENYYIPQVIEEGLLAPLDWRLIPNFRLISPNFRDLALDPGNKYTVPYSWGTTGIVVRTDRYTKPVTSWVDLFQADNAAQVVLWESTPRYTLGAALLALGYSINTENPAEIQAAADLLIQIKPQTFWLVEESSILKQLTDPPGEGGRALGLGWSYDYWLVREQTESVQYILPKEGSILWMDFLAIPAASPNREAAQLLLNFFLEPKVSAAIVEFSYFTTPVEAAFDIIDPAILSDPIVFPPDDSIRNSEMILPLSSAGEAVFEKEWARFLAAPGH